MKTGEAQEPPLLKKHDDPERWYQSGEQKGNSSLTY